MGKEYEWDINPFQDFLFGSIMNGINITDKKFETEVYMSLFAILEYYVPYETENKHLDFEIKNKKGSFKIIGKNIITALWISGIFPNNIQQVLNENEYIDRYNGVNIKYRFNVKTKKLTYKSIK